MEDYRTLLGTAAGEYEEKKSRFAAAAAHAETEQQALAFVASVRAASRGARHNVYAWRLADGGERCSDDGEPAKTAGLPVLEQLQHAGLYDTVLVVTRWFGGVLLGTGGLVRAYSTAAGRALAAAQIAAVCRLVRLEAALPYALYERAALYIAQAGGRAETPQFTDCVRLAWTMPDGTQAPLLAQLQELSAGRAAVQVSAPFYAPWGAAESAPPK